MIIHMTRVLLMMAVVASVFAAAPTQEKGMKLELLTTTNNEKKQTLVTASLRNTGNEPVHILLEFMLSRTSGKLTNDGGKELEARNAAAARGPRVFESGKINTRELKPGEEIEVQQFSINPSGPHAFAGDYSWDLTEVKSRTLTLEMSYEVTEKAARIAKLHKAPDVAVGRWSSKPVILPYQK
jgi:hypothetical protein